MVSVMNFNIEYIHIFSNVGDLVQDVIKQLVNRFYPSERSRGLHNRWNHYLLSAEA